MPRPRATPRRDLHAEITNRILAAVEADPGLPKLPWRSRAGGPLMIPRNYTTRARYSGVNVVNLWVATQTRGFSSPQFASYKQWQAIGGQVRKGEKSELVVFYRSFDVDPDPSQPDDDGKRRVARASYVFNIDQVDGVDAPPAPERLPPIDRIEAADRFVANTKANIVIGGNSAFYRANTDTIYIPAEELFTGTDTMTRQEAFYATELHELVHYAAIRIMPRRHESSRDGRTH